MYLGIVAVLSRFPISFILSKKKDRNTRITNLHAYALIKYSPTCNILIKDIMLITKYHNLKTAYISEFSKSSFYQLGIYGVQECTSCVNLLMDYGEISMTESRFSLACSRCLESGEWPKENCYANK